MIEFLRAELAPVPGRLHATLRLVAASIFVTVLVMGLHIPHGQWGIITLFTVMQPDAGATLRKGVQRIGGTLVGGLAALLGIVLLGDQPWFLVPFIGLAGTVALLLSRTLSAPYVGLLGGLTFMILLPSPADPPAMAVDAALWRVLVVAMGTAIGTAAHLVLWPDDPEEMLRSDLTHRLGIADTLLDQILRGEGAGSPLPSLLTVSGLARELDLLSNTEVRHPSSRRHSTVQSGVIGETDRLLTAVLEFAGAVRDHPIDASLRRRLEDARAACTVLAAAILAPGARNPAVPTPPRAAPTPPRAAAEATRGEAGGGSAPTRFPAAEAHLVEVERALQAMARIVQSDVSIAGEPTQARSAAITWIASPTDPAALRFALKGGIAAVIAYLFTQGLAWPGISTAIVTTLIVAQSSVGAGVQKAVLRVAGAVAGGLLALVVITVAMPNLENFGGFLVVFALAVGAAAWVDVGSSRIAYAGLQIALALAISLFSVFGPTTSLVFGRDRVIGILLGIAIMTLVDRTIWPVYARDQMRPHMARSLEHMAGLARVALARVARSPVLDARRTPRRAVYDELATVLRLADEARIEPGAAAPERFRERQAVLELAATTQAVMLSLLAAVRHRLDVDLVEPLPEVAGEMDRFVSAVAARLETIARAIETSSGAGMEELERRLDAIELRLEDLARSAATDLLALAHARERLVVDRQLAAEVEELAREAESSKMRPEVERFAEVALAPG